jgi:predicted nucleotidyltransferase component of viral defense system
VRRDFIDEVARTQNITRADLVEKDLLLHQVLFDLSKNKFFHDNFAFKGGTCLAKCYLDYFRLSEDIDFTWKDQSVFEGKSQKAIRRYLSVVIDRLGVVFEGIAKVYGLDFKCLKDNRDYVELSGGDKICTFKVWYHSEVFGRKSFFKVQMNFVEKICYPFCSAELNSVISKNQEELALLFSEYQACMGVVGFDVYDVREILAEKIRAILTRRGIKARDFLDVYLIGKVFGVSLDEVFSCVVEKLEFTLALYGRYRQNLEAKKVTFLSAPFSWGDEKGLLLKEIDDKDFYCFIENLRGFLERVVNNLA